MKGVKKCVVLENDEITNLFKRLVENGAAEIKSYKRFLLESTGINKNGINSKVESSEGIGILKMIEDHKTKSTLNFNIDEIKNVINMLNLFDQSNFLINYLVRTQYLIDGILVNLDTSTFFEQGNLEASIQIDNSDETANAERKLVAFLNTFGLKEITDTSTLAHDHKYLVDFKNTDIEEWFDIWEDYIFCRN